jgi:hypothetical protein
MVWKTLYLKKSELEDQGIDGDQQRMIIKPGRIQEKSGQEIYPLEITMEYEKSRDLYKPCLRSETREVPTSRMKFSLRGRGYNIPGF